MTDVMRMADIAVLIEAAITEGGEFVLYPRGTSMQPFLRENETAAVLVAPDSIKKHDTVLYRRENGVYVLHRIVKIRRDGYTMCGDNQYVLEHGIQKSQIVARVSAIITGDMRDELSGKKYRRYLRRLPLRRLYKRLRAYARVIIKGRK